MLLSAYISLLRSSKHIPQGLICAIAGRRLLASAAEGKGAARWYKDVKVVPNVKEVGLGLFTSSFHVTNMQVFSHTNCLGQVTHIVTVSRARCSYAYGVRSGRQELNVPNLIFLASRKPCKARDLLSSQMKALAYNSFRASSSSCLTDDR